MIEKIGEKAESLEKELLQNPSPAVMNSLHRLKRELIFLRKSIWPLREVVGNLHRGEPKLITKEVELFLRDVYDHTLQVMDSIETLRDITSGMLDTYLSSISNKMNEVMKTLTIIATIFIPLTFIAGIYGMNFDVMPELHWYYGYFFVWAFMVFVGILMIAYFRRKRWV